MADQLASADAFVLPSRWEGLPYSILEAVSASLPVVASRVGGVPELVVHEVTGLLVEPGSVSDMASALKRLHQSGEAARSYGRAGYLRARQLFTHDAMLAGYNELFTSLLATRAMTSAASTVNDSGRDERDHAVRKTAEDDPTS